MADELRPRAVPRPVPSPGHLSPDQLPGEGRPPMRAGVHMTDFTRSQLQKIGWKDGDPIPGDLGKRIQEIQQAIREERESTTLEDSPLAAGWKPVQAKFMDIGALPPEKQAELKQYLEEYNAQIAQEEAFNKQQAKVESRIPENIQGQQRELMVDQIMASEAALQRRQLQQTGTVIDDRPVRQPVESGPPPGMPVPEGKVFAGNIGMPSIAQKIKSLKQQQQPAVEPLPPEEPVVSSGATTTHDTCQRCAWPLSMPFTTEPTVEDKQGFLAAIIGLSRFEKEYALLGDNLILRLRSLSSDETATLQNQLSAMVRAGQSIGDGEYWSNLMEFRLVMSVSRITVGGNVIYSAPPVKEWDTANPQQADSEIHPTPLPRMRTYFYEKGVTQEPLRRIIGQTHQEFQRLVEALEAMTNNADFWTGIKLPV